ncbi:MAG: hypothetical protein HY054_10920 [Proteobacteria bacterium]|nr:hypothetical protein [Pseudomonadota bacterium]
MPADNVTPFRRPPKRVQQRQQGGMGFKTHRGKAVLVHALTLAAFTLNFIFPTGIESLLGTFVGLGAAFLAYSNRYDGMPWAATHHEHVFRTVLIGYSLWTVASALTYVNGIFVPVAIYTHLAIIVWAGIRSGVGLVLAMMRRPIWHPKGWLL